MGEMRPSRRSSLVSFGLGAPAVAALVLLGLPSVARAQMGTGWKEFFPMKTIQLRGAGAKYDNTNGIETFSIAPGDERSEARIFDDHRTGKWQFEGWVNVKAGIDGGCIHQVFKFLMIVGYSNDGGELRQHSQQRLQATGVFGKWVRVNTIHDADAGTAQVYIDGTLRGNVVSKSPGPNGWYHKYGIYNSSGSNPEVKWRDVKFFTGPGTSPPASDAGPPSSDASVDVVVPADASSAEVVRDSSGAGDSVGAGGSSATGSGGTSPVGTGGQTRPRGTGGSGAGGATTNPEPPPSQGAGCSCRVRGAQTAGGAGPWIIFVLVLAAVGGRQRRRR
jgi:MYXO-CTERM domain-containing protein